MKKYIAMSVALILCCGHAAQVFVSNGVQYVNPAEFAKENKLAYSNNFGDVTLKSASTTLLMLTGSKGAELNGNAFEMQGPLTNISGNLVAPLLDLQKAFGLKVTTKQTATVSPAPTTTSAYVAPVGNPSPKAEKIVPSTFIAPNVNLSGTRSEFFTTKAIEDAFPYVHYETVFGKLSIKALKDACVKSTRDDLKTPSVAQFPTVNTPTYHTVGKVYTISGDVDSQNSYGAMIRNKFFCTIGFEGNAKAGLLHIATDIYK